MALARHALSLLLLQILTQGSEAETVFVKTGEDLRLTGPGSVELTKGQDLTWKHNGSNNIVKLLLGGDVVMIDDYDGRVEFLKENHSLLVKKMNQDNSGEYTAVVSRKKDEVVARHQVQVLDPVGPVELVKVNVSLTDNTCDLNVTCGPINKSFTCTNANCQDGTTEDKDSGSTYRILFENGNITCNRSNQVSWTSDTEAVQVLCPLDWLPPPRQIWVWILIALLLLLLAFGVGMVLYKKRRKNKIPMEQLPQIYDEPMEFPPSSNGEPDTSPNSTYALVEFHTGPAAAPPPENDLPPETPPPENDLPPETLYAQVDKLRLKEGNDALNRL